MGRRCKCTICKAELNTDTAYLWTHYTAKTTKKFYFCSEKEFIDYTKEKALSADRKKRVNCAINEILGYVHSNSMLFKSEDEWSKNEDVVQAIEVHVSDLYKLMSYKGFDIHSVPFHVYKYLSAVINNNLTAWVSEIQMKREIDAGYDKLTIEHSEYKAKSHQKRTKKCLDDYE